MKKAYEAAFHTILLKSGFEEVTSNYHLIANQNQRIEIDHVAIKYLCLFIFEGKSNKLDKAKKQLSKKSKILVTEKENLIHLFGEFNSIRYFAYSWNQHSLIEIDSKEEITFKFKNSTDLINYLKNI